MSKSIFFKPFKGDKYEIGINGKKVLVVGASFYCNKTDCPFFADCTNVAKKDSSKYLTWKISNLVVDLVDSDADDAVKAVESNTEEINAFICVALKNNTVII